MSEARTVVVVGEVVTIALHYDMYTHSVSEIVVGGVSNVFIS